jgi:signal transduction histidine kinase/CheY-like chemotaxis protein
MRQSVANEVFAPLDPGLMIAARVLVVEDEHLVALDIKLHLERMGHTAVVVYSGEDALDMIAQMHFDLVLMDIKLKGSIDGVEAARTIRDAHDVPVIYLTAYADNHTIERARATEPYGYLLKPFQERELKAAIEMALKRHDSDRRRLEEQELQRFLADATGRMAASLDYRAVAIGAGELLVPKYADWCTIHLKETNDSIPHYTYTRPDPEGESTTNGHGAHLVDSVLRTGNAELLPNIDDPRTLHDALGSQHLEGLRALGARSLLCVPLRARDKVLGALALVAGRMRPRYGTSDMLFAEDFAHRLGMALDNALLYRRSERAIRMRDDVLAIVSHDLRTPLGTVLLQAESLGEQPQTRKVGEAIVRSAQRMNRLIGDLLDASAVNAGQLALDCKVHSVSDVICEAIEMYRSQAEARKLKLEERLPSEPVYINGDRDRLVQVLSNLVGNAVKFTPHGGHVTVAVTRAAQGVRILVRDTGRGIPPDHVPYLFDRFWRAQAHRNGGAGLGLFIARGIVAAHGSKLEVETKVGEGSCFSFVLPEVTL